MGNTIYVDGVMLFERISTRECIDWLYNCTDISRVSVKHKGDMYTALAFLELFKKPL